MNVNGCACLLLAALAGWGGFAEEVSFRQPVVCPPPKEMTYEESVAVRLDAALRLVVRCDDPAASAWVSERLKQWFGAGPRVEAAPCAGTFADEGYELLAVPGRLEISARTLQGVRYALYTLRQVAERESSGRTLKGYRLPQLHVRDEPRFAFRGAHFCWFPEQSAVRIERQIRLAAMYKFNYAVIESWGTFRSERHAVLSYPDAPLTVAEARRLAALAKDLGITLIPQINVFGHAAAARDMGGRHATLDFHPEFQPLFEPDGWNWCLSNPEARAVCREIVAEMHEAFGSPPYFHIGCDEADPPSCATCRRARPYARLVERHITEVAEMLRKRGARAMMWHDMLLGKRDGWFPPFHANGSPDEVAMVDNLPKDIVICDWYYGGEYLQDAVRRGFPTFDYFKKRGFSSVTCPWKDLQAIAPQAKAASEAGLMGLLQTTWHRFSGKQFQHMMQYGACAAWGDRPRLAKDRDMEACWRRCGWDMGIRDYAEAGYYRQQVTDDILDK